MVFLRTYVRLTTCTGGREVGCELRTGPCGYHVILLVLHGVVERLALGILELHFDADITEHLGADLRLWRPCGEVEGEERYRELISVLRSDFPLRTIRPACLVEEFTGSIGVVRVPVLLCDFVEEPVNRGRWASPQISAL